MFDARGEPVAGVEVRAGGCARETDATGAFTLEDLRAGTVQVDAHEAGTGRRASEEVELVAGRTARVVLRLALEELSHVESDEPEW